MKEVPARHVFVSIQNGVVELHDGPEGTVLHVIDHDFQDVSDGIRWLVGGDETLESTFIDLYARGMEFSDIVEIYINIVKKTWSTQIAEWSNAN